MHPAEYAQVAEHLARLTRLEQALGGLPAAGESESAQRREAVDEELEQLGARRAAVRRGPRGGDQAARDQGLARLHVSLRGFPAPAAGCTSSRSATRRPSRGCWSTRPTGQILDCDLSYDGRTILFSWRRKQDEGYHLWTVNVDGTRPEATDRRRVARLQRLLAARRRHRLPQHAARRSSPTAGTRRSASCTA